MTRPGVSTILNGYGTKSDRGTPPTRQFEVGSSLALLARRVLNSASAQGRNGTVSPAFIPLVMSSISLRVGRQRPAIDGLPSAVRGAGAVRSARPSAVRGIPGVGFFSH